MNDMDEELSNDDSDCQECVSLQAALDKVTNWLEDKLEAVGLDGWVLVNERELDNLLSQLVAVANTIGGLV